MVRLALGFRPSKEYCFACIGFLPEVRAGLEAAPEAGLLLLLSGEYIDRTEENISVKSSAFKIELSAFAMALVFFTGDVFGVAYEELNPIVLTADGPLLSIIFTMAALTSASKELR